LRLLVVFLPVERDREVEPPFAGVLLLRDAVGEDVRVAMLANVRENLRCPMRHTPWVADGGRGASERRLAGVKVLKGAATETVTAPGRGVTRLQDPLVTEIEEARQRRLVGDRGSEGAATERDTARGRGTYPASGSAPDGG
jgi:hypothetical protein